VREMGFKPASIVQSGLRAAASAGTVEPADEKKSRSRLPSRFTSRRHRERISRSSSRNGTTGAAGVTPTRGNPGY